MMEYIIAGAPVPCPRPRVSRWGTYYPAKYKAWKEKATAVLQDLEPTQELEIIFILARPKSAGKGSRRLSIKKPDIDNLIKSVMDSLPFDDKIINKITASKYTASSDEEPRTILLIEPYKTIPF